MDSQPPSGTALTSFDPLTAAAVTRVLQRAGITAWTEPVPGWSDELEVVVSEGDRERALIELTRRMEEVNAEVRRELAATARPAPPRTPDGEYDEYADGPPLVMQRFRDLRLVVVVLMVPLLAVVVAGPFVPRAARVAVIVIMAAVLAVALWARRQHQRR